MARVGRMDEDGRTGGGGNGLGIDDIGSANSPYRVKRPGRVAEWRGQMRWATYARSSTKPQVGRSEDRQEEKNKAYVDSRGGIIVRSYVDSGLTGVQTQGRDALEEMLDEAGRGIFDALCFEDVSRLARHRVDTFRIYSALAVAGIELHASTFGPLDIYALALQAYVAEKERVDILGRMLGGRRVAAAKGRRVAAVNYGFVLDPYDRSKQVPDPVLAPVIRQMYEMSAAGTTAHSIARAFTGVHPSPADRLRKMRDPSYADLSVWSPDTVGKLLRNPIYAGVVCFGKTRLFRDAADHRVSATVQAPVEDWIATHVPSMALLGIDLWSRGQRASAGQAYSRHSGNANHDYLLENLRCGGCRKRLLIHQDGTYRCLTPRVTCEGVGSLKAHRVESEVLRLLAGACASAPRTVVEAVTVTPETRRRSLEHEKDEAERELRKGLRSLCVAGAASDAMVARWRELDGRIQALRTAIAAVRVETEIPSIEPADLGGQILAEISDHRFDTGDPAKAQVCAAIRGALREVRVLDDGDMQRVEVDVALGAIWPGRFDATATQVLAGGMPRAGRHPDSIREIAMREVRARLPAPPPPTPEETASLETALDRTTDAGHRARLEAVLLCLGGHRCHEAAARVGATERDAFIWLTAYREAGQEVLLRSNDVELLDFVRGRVDEACDRAIARVRSKWAGNVANSKGRLRIRRDALVAYLDGSTTADIEVGHAMIGSTFQTILAGVELVGPTGFHLPQRRPIAWADGQLEEIRAIVATGHDPDDPDRPVNMPVLHRICRERYGFTNSADAIRRNLAKRGVRIRETLGNPPSPTRKRADAVRALVEDKVGHVPDGGRVPRPVARVDASPTRSIEPARSGRCR